MRDRRMNDNQAALKDDFYILCIIFVVHGVGTDMPWFMHVNAYDYFVLYKLHANYTGMNETHYTTFYYRNVTITTMVPLLFVIWANVFLSTARELLDMKVITSLTLEILLFLFTIILAMVDTNRWPNVFLCLTIFTIVLLNMANGLHQSVVYGLASRISRRYVAYLVIGKHLSGVVTAIAGIAGATSPGPLQLKAIYYFTIALFVLFLCLHTYLALPLIKYYRITEYLRKRKIEWQRRRRRLTSQHIPYCLILKRTFPQLANLFLVSAVTYSIFPIVQANIIQVHTNSFLNAEMFKGITCFLSFNVFATVGSCIGLLVQWPRKEYLIIPVALRVLYIPFFLFSNYHLPQSTRKQPVLIQSDTAYFIVSVTMAVSSGYLSVIAFQYAPGLVAFRDRFTAGTFAIAAFATGAGAGVVFDYIIPTFI